MTRIYRRLIRLYPDDIRFAYGAELDAEFRRGLADSGSRGRFRRTAFVVRAVARLLVEAAFERVHTLYSHRSFHGRGRPDLGLVRPPNMSKQEWFGGGGAGVTAQPPPVTRATARAKVDGSIAG